MGGGGAPPVQAKAFPRPVRPTKRFPLRQDIDRHILIAWAQ